MRGLIMRPCSLTHEDNKKVFQSSEYWIDRGFRNKYQEHLVANDIIVECAKIYIIENWEKISDWSSLDVKIRDNTRETTHYYKFDEKVLESGSKIWRELMSSKKEKQNPIKKLSGVVLDTTDGDFSLTINGKEHLWIDRESVITIADFIEDRLMIKEQDVQVSDTTEVDQGGDAG